MTLFIIGYDVKSRKRLQRIRKKMTSCSLPLQLSVFLFEGTEHACQACLREASQLLDLRTDDLRCYQLPSSVRTLHMGRSALPEGIFWLSASSMIR